MTQEPLKDQIEKLIIKYTSVSGANGSFIAKEILKIIKKRAEGLIKFHEDRIEELIKELEELNVGDTEYFKFFGHIELEKEFGSKMEQIEKEYESIMAIEHWLEDVIT